MTVLLWSVLFWYQLPQQPTFYDVFVDFDGYIPVLGGLTTKAQVSITLSVKALDDAPDGMKRAENTLSSFKMSLLDKSTGKLEPLPVPLQNARTFFPNSTITHTKFGQIAKTTAPDIQLPIRLPGLRSNHLPDITYMLLQFPESGFDADKGWTYKRDFGDSEVTITANYKGKDERGEKFELSMTQAYTTYEDSNRNTLASKENAASRVETQVKGRGFVWFDSPAGKISAAELSASASSDVVSLKGEPATKRLLSMSVLLKNRMSPPK